MSAPMKRIPVVVDLPVNTPKLGFEKYVEALAAAVLGGTPARYTIGLYGPWGTGKSSILHALDALLKNSDEPPLVVKFDAWRHERVENVMLPFLWTIQEAVKSIEELPASKKISKASAKKAASALGKLIRGMEFGLLGVTLRMPENADSPANNQNVAINATEQYMESFNQLQILGESISGRIVVLIDDLDRCTPDRVVELIETIRLLMDVEGFVFVLAIDYEVLLDAIHQKYQHADPEKFIEKIVQVPFWIPSLRIEDDDLLNSLIPRWDELRDEWFAGVEAKHLQTIFKLALRGNPRQIKRLLNSYLVARHVVGDQEERSNLILTASIAMQLRWPKQFRFFERRLNLVAYSENPESDVKNTKVYETLTSQTGSDYDDLNQELDDPKATESAQDKNELGEYVKEFFGASLQIGELLDIMRIAANVTQGAAATEIPSRIQKSIRKGEEFETELLSELKRIAEGEGAIFDSESRTWRNSDGGIVLRIQSINHKAAEALLEFGEGYSFPRDYAHSSNVAFVNREMLADFILDMNEIK
ncbi:KAP family P-loop NTPase fold protein [Glutamicibacter sp.]|uniref:KAP family P-loop NTPase fold protein n=1 Tax=Glutamicibacter sp. TaxID=1931995 RepID=UPI002B494458|nr:P-loop NTPase fold protein [Glutamicibacter sp.]HJX79392.1 P-loop NTPase fold protein [Glutamicibacter sp.]